MVKDLYLGDTVEDFVIPAGFTYCSLLNLGTSEATLTTTNGHAPLVAGTPFDVPVDLAGNEGINVQTNGNRIAIFYKMK